jgi:predicted unusual protein kinase regulating ubiquinone biosynthesis (AarF/ABC1/UbiB family)
MKLINNRKLKIWDFSSRFIIRKKIIDYIYKNDKQNYSKEIKSLGIWTKDYITDLGPTFIKLGQSLSTRSDLFPIEFLEQIEDLQDNVTEIDKDELQNCLNNELNEPVNIFFTYFEMTPYKSASLGQVHKAILKSGKKVAVKIQRPGVKDIVLEDINNIIEVIDFFDIIGYSTGPSAKEIFNEAKYKLLDELDYKKEMQNALIFRNNFKNIDSVIIPRVYLSKSTDKLLIMEWVNSYKITDIESIKNNNLDPVDISKLFLKIFIIQFMDHGIFHADPHPGNIGISKSGKIVIYDYGLIIKLPENIKNKSKDIIMSILQRDTKNLVEIFISMGIIIPNNNKYEISLFFDSIINYIEKVENISDPDVREEIILKLSNEKPFNIPSSFIFLTKTLGIIEGICTRLDPEFSFFNYLEPYFQETIMESIDLQKMATSTLEIPSKINYISTSISNIEQQKSEIDIKLNKYEKSIKTNNYIIVSLLTANNIMISETNLEIITLLIIAIYFFISQKKNLR